MADLFLADEHKICKNCGFAKPLSEFYLHSGRPAGICKRCAGIETMENRAKRGYSYASEKARNPDGIKKWRRSSYVNRRSGFAGWINVNLTTRRQQCRKAGVEFTLTVEDVVALYERQKGLCALTGRELKWGLDTNRGPDTLSMDRIQAEGPYTLENVRLVTHWANVARQRFTDSEFLGMCRAVIETIDRPLATKQAPWVSRA